MNVMQWTELLGNLGEFLGSMAVMVTLVILVVQVRQSAKAVLESNRLQRGGNRPPQRHHRALAASDRGQRRDVAHLA